MTDRTLHLLAIACGVVALCGEALIAWVLWSTRKQGPSISVPDAESVSITVHGPGGGGGRTIPVRHVDAEGNVLHVGVGTIEESYGPSGKEES